MEPVDIVVLFCSDQDSYWKTSMSAWKKLEIKNGILDPENPQSCGSERFRDWDMFKYFFRGIEKNCEWVNKIFLVVANFRQVPSWINRLNPKLRIVYHKDFIPKDYLPTFNAVTIQYFLSDIKDLSENYIMFDDDCIVCNKIPKDRFVRDGKPVLPNNRVTYNMIPGNDKYFAMLNNNRRFELQFMKDDPRAYMIHHQPSSKSKSFENEIKAKYGKELEESFAMSRFRNVKNIETHALFDDLIRIMDRCIIDAKMYSNCHYTSLTWNIDWNSLTTKDMICFNDTGPVKDFQEKKRQLLEFLERVLPEKSSYEV